MSEPGFPAPRPRLCPRCGYDQQGVIDSWTEACPVRSPCSECGYDIEWSKVLGPQADVLPWFVEHVPRSGFARACVQTLMRVPIPSHFWRSVQLYHPMRLRRAVLFLVCAILVCQLGATLALGVDRYLGLLESGPSSLGAGPVTFYDQDTPKDLASCLFAGAGQPYVDVEVGEFAAILFGEEALSLRMMMFLLWGGGFVVALMATLLVPGALALTSTTLRQAKVQPKQVVRATVYSLAWLVLFEILHLSRAGLWLVANSEAIEESEIGEAISGLYAGRLIGPAFVALWLFVYWHSTLVFGWRVRQPLWHTFLLIVLVSLGAAVGGYLLVSVLGVAPEIDRWG